MPGVPLPACESYSSGAASPPAPSSPVRPPYALCAASPSPAVGGRLLAREREHLRERAGARARREAAVAPIEEIIHPLQDVELVEVGVQRQPCRVEVEGELDWHRKQVGANIFVRGVGRAVRIHQQRTSRVAGEVKARQLATEYEAATDALRSHHQKKNKRAHWPTY